MLAVFQRIDRENKLTVASALWIHWWNAIVVLRPAFSRQRTFLWFIVCVAGMSVRSDNLGVSSIVRALGLDERFYDNLLDCYHSTGIKLSRLSALWTRTVLSLFGEKIARVNGRPVLLADGKKNAKEGKKMPGVKSLHQDSESNTKPSFIMGHSTQAVAVLARAASTFFAVPLDIKIHEGLIFSNRDKRTLLDKLLNLVNNLKLNEPCYLVADAYYASGKMVKGTLAQGHDLVTRAKSNCVAYSPLPAPRGKRPPGRPKLYGKKLKLSNLFRSTLKVSEIPSPVYDEKGIMIRVRCCDLLWRPAGRLVRFVLVEHPTRGRLILMCSDLQLDAVQIIRLYGLRFKIELGFKQAAHVIGTFDYHFWMMDMKPLKRRNGNQHLHRESEAYRCAVRRKLNAYHIFLFTGVVAQGLMHYLSSCHTDLVWRSFGSWLRTVRKGVAPSEMVVTMALRNTLSEFLLVCSGTNIMAKFIEERQDRSRADFFGKAA
jgi:hypothetical protein